MPLEILRTESGYDFSTHEMIKYMPVTISGKQEKVLEVSETAEVCFVMQCMHQLGMPYPTLECQFKSQLLHSDPASCYYILGGCRRWLKFLGCCYPHARPKLSCGFLASTWPSPGYSGYLGSKPVEGRSTNFPLTLHLSRTST